MFSPVSFGVFLRLPSRTQDGLKRQSLLLDDKQQAYDDGKDQFVSKPIHVVNILQKNKRLPAGRRLSLNMIVACKLHCSNRNQLLTLNQDEKQQGADN